MRFLREDVNEREEEYTRQHLNAFIDVSNDLSG